jgi:hypothetical protein
MAQQSDPQLFLSADFCNRFWLPILKDGIIIDGAKKPEKPLFWVRLLSTFKLKFAVILLALLLSVFAARGKTVTAYKQFAEWAGIAPITVPDPVSIGSLSDLIVAMKTLEGKKSNLSRIQTKQVSTDLTGKLLTSDSKIDRATRRRMNKTIVNTLLFLNDRDLSFIWRALPENLDLSYIDMSVVNLRGVRFVKSFLIYTDFSNAELDDVVFDDAWVRNADFSDASLSKVVFSKTDWFNGFGLPVDKKDGLPTDYGKWRTCPQGYKTSGRQSFIKLLDSWYAIKFSQLEQDDADQLIDAWETYGKEGGLCDQVVQSQLGKASE